MEASEELLKQLGLAAPVAHAALAYGFFIGSTKTYPMQRRRRSPSGRIKPTRCSISIDLPESCAVNGLRSPIPVSSIMLLTCARPQAAEKFKMPREFGRQEREKELNMISALIGVLIIIVVGAICFWAIDRFANDRRLAQLLKLLVVLICLGAILQRILPFAGIY
jgi:hypothetical protein